jgi:hypothetical protein
MRHTYTACDFCHLEGPFVFLQPDKKRSRFVGAPSAKLLSPD